MFDGLKDVVTALPTFLDVQRQMLALLVEIRDELKRGTCITIPTVDAGCAGGAHVMMTTGARCYCGFIAPSPHGSTGSGHAG